MALIVLTIVTTTALVVFHNQSVRYQRQINQTTKQLEDEKQRQRTQLQQQMHLLQLQNDAKQQQINQLNQQLQAKRATQSTLAEAISTTVGTVTPIAYVVPSDNYKALVYGRESGNNPNSVSGNGACGLGQALPCSKMDCALGDYACQDNWFTNYMLNRYHTWYNAWQHELAYGWW